MVLGLVKREEREKDDIFWVLQDVSFRLEKGKTIGFIGANGAGKSTALKLISRIIEPTRGEVHVFGRVGALLELGSGFHPDLTGRENIYLNGSILGFTKSDISQKLDEIVAFSELERFIDMPIRNYSSGMMVRLGFSVATAFWPEILLIDEVLAVGDQTFQSRCVQRIQQIQDAGTTVILVSHDLSTVRRMCDRVLWIDSGTVQAEGKPDKVINRYLESVWANEVLLQDLSEDAEGQRWGSGEIRIQRVELMGENGQEQLVFNTRDAFKVRMWYKANEPVAWPAFGIGLYDERGNYINGPNMIWSGAPVKSVDGEGYVDYIVESLPLLPGRYSLTAAIYDRRIQHPYDHWHRMKSFVVSSSEYEQQDGVVHIPCEWKHVDVR